MFLPFENDFCSTAIKVFPNFLTKEECEILIDYGNKQNKKIAEVGNENINKEIRKNKIVWFGEKDISLKWVMDKIANIVFNQNNNLYKFDLYGLTEDLQFTIYDTIDDGYKWHYDSGGASVRKLSLSIQLSDPKDYEGCELEFIESASADKEAKETLKPQGTLVLFPSYLAHRVTPLTQGTRYSLVTWVGGPKFK
jgi:PKHD-type hydroxylase